jgi:hypothetical protein
VTDFGNCGRREDAMKRLFNLAGLLGSLLLTATILSSAPANAAEYDRVSITIGKKASADLAKLVGKLRQAAKREDAAFVLESISDDFRCLRDFGGACTEKMSASEKFAATVGVGRTGSENNFATLESLLSETLFAPSTALGELTAPLTCAPAIPAFDERRVVEIDTKLFKGDGETFAFNWVAIEDRNVAAFNKPVSGSAKAGTLSRELVHVDRSYEDPHGKWIKVDLPAGKQAFVQADKISDLLPVQLCYSKHPKHGWQISAFVGGGD